MVIGKHFEFEASHILPGEIYGKCSNLHGHTYKLKVEISGEINEDGWIVNFSDIKQIIEAKVIIPLDHSHLNTRIKLPTAENILLWIENEIRADIESIGAKLYKLTLYETSKSFAILEC